MNILALGAHPDDIEFLCAGTLFKYKQQGHNIFIALTTSGNQGSNEYDSREEIAAVREAEQLEAAKVLGAEVRFMRFDDEGLINTPESRRAVINAMRWANPDVILTNYPHDPSTDHGTTGKLVTDLILSMPGKNIPADEPPIAKKISVFYWDVPGGIDFLPEVYVDISDVLHLKLEALSKHESQVAWMANYTDDDFLEYCTTLARFRGIQAGCKYAEGFRALRIHGYMPNFKLLP
ncbi:MAG: PIG-L deacetylase family protein [Armatimonadota bacterium]